MRRALPGMIAAGGLVLLPALAPAASLAQGEPQSLVTIIPLDGEATVGGVKAACTGIGQTRDDPKWAAYPVRVEFSNAANEYLIGATVQVRTAAGKPLLAVDCDGPWVLLDLPPGRYVVEGRIDMSPAKPRSAPVTPPRSGQIRVVLQFPDA